MNPDVVAFIAILGTLLGLLFGAVIAVLLLDYFTNRRR